MVSINVYYTKQYPVRFNKVHPNRDDKMVDSERENMVIQFDLIDHIKHDKKGNIV